MVSFFHVNCCFSFINKLSRNCHSNWSAIFGEFTNDGSNMSLLSKMTPPCHGLLLFLCSALSTKVVPGSPNGIAKRALQVLLPTSRGRKNTPCIDVSTQHWSDYSVWGEGKCDPGLPFSAFVTTAPF